MNYKNGLYCKDRINYCIDCLEKGIKTEICPQSIRCRKCCFKWQRKFSQKGKDHPSYKDGKYCKDNINFCKDCGKRITLAAKRCLSCAMIELFKNPINCPNYKDGKTNKKYFCKDCAKELKSWKSIRCNSCANRITFSQRIKKPNRIEKQLNKLLNQLLPKEYKYVGNFKFWIENFNPDFINCNGQKKIIELFGDYWHNREDAKQRDKLRLKTYVKYGYKTLIIWEKELKNIRTLSKKLRKF